MENYFFLKTVLHNFVHYQSLTISRYQVRSYANNYFGYLPIVSTAFKQLHEIGPSWLSHQSMGSNPGHDTFVFWNATNVYFAETLDCDCISSSMAG